MGDVIDMPEPVDYEALWNVIPPPLLLFINSEARLKRLIELDAPETILDHERGILARRAREATLYCAGVFGDLRTYDKTPEE